MDHGILANNDQMTGVVEELSYADTIEDLEGYFQDNKNPNQQFVPVNSMEMYMIIGEFLKDILTPSNLGNTVEVQIDTKYKMVEKK